MIRLPIGIVLACMILALSAQELRAQCNGNMGVRAYFAPGSGPQDITGLRYKFHVADNTQSGLSLKILFAALRLYTPGAVHTYLLESNLYTRGLTYADPTCTTWPLLGTLVGSQASLRLAVPDYIGLGKTGAKTFAPSVFPRQSYLVDGLPVPKTDAISQLDLNQQTTEVVITRDGLVSDKTGWKCVGSLDDDEYRRWNASATIGPESPESYEVAFALPDSNARFFTPNELINFRTEFYLFPGLFRVYLWDFQFMRESTGYWEPLEQWIVDDQCGDTSAYGVRLAAFEGRTVMEISNDGPASFIPVGTIFGLGPAGLDIDIKPGSVQNRVNPGSRGVIPIAILSTDSFDAAEVDPATVTFGPGMATPAHSGGHLEDANGDGLPDLVLHFRVRDALIASADSEACVTATTFAGELLSGCDTVRIVGR